MGRSQRQWSQEPVQTLGLSTPLLPVSYPLLGALQLQIPLTLCQHRVHQPAASQLSTARQTLAPDPAPARARQHWHCSLAGAARRAALPLPLPEPLPAPGALGCAAPGLGPLAGHGAGLRAGCALLLGAHARGESGPRRGISCSGVGGPGCWGGRLEQPRAAPLLALVFADLPNGTGLSPATCSAWPLLTRFSSTTKLGVAVSSSRKPSCWSCPSPCPSSMC